MSVTSQGRGAGTDLFGTATGNDNGSDSDSGCVFRTSQVAQVVSVASACSICIKFAYEFRVDKLQAANGQQTVAAAA